MFTKTFFHIQAILCILCSMRKALLPKPFDIYILNTLVYTNYCLLFLFYKNIKLIIWKNILSISISLYFTAEIDREDGMPNNILANTSSFIHTNKSSHERFYKI